MKMMTTVQESNRILFVAQWKRAFERPYLLPFLCGIGPVIAYACQALTSPPLPIVTAAAVGIVGYWVVFYASLLLPQRIFLLSDRLRFISCFWKKDVPFAKMRAISLVPFTPRHVHLNFQMKNGSVVIPVSRASCCEILRILTREAPQAEMNELAAKWRDGLESETLGHQSVTA